jgi:anthranilate phosphoribosyltransferase
MIKELIQKAMSGQNLTEEDAFAGMGALMEGEATDAQIGAWLAALRMKGETVEEVTGFARAMRSRVVPVEAPPEVIDTCGTGGDRSGTFNISTAAALVAAGAGAKVAKHGNRSVSSQSGSADVLKALGVKIDAGPEVVAACIREAGIGFLFAPGHHPAMKHVIGARREMGVRTVFNILGPLTNPAGAKRQVMGVFDAAWLEPLAKVLGKLGAERAFLVHGEDGLDEISTTAPTSVSEWRDGGVQSYTVTPEDVGLTRARPGDLAVSSAEESAQTVRDVLAGRKGPCRDIVVLNAACALAAGGLAEDLRAGVAPAEQAIDSGAAGKALESLVAASNR